MGEKFKITPFMRKIGFKKLKKTPKFNKCSDNFENKMPLFLINCAIHKMRLEKFKESAKNAKLKFCRESCVNGKKFTDNIIYKMYTHKPQIVKKKDITPIEISIFMSHINAWIKILDSGCKCGMVMEDDVILKKTFKKNVDLTLRTLEEHKKKFDILFLWNGNWANTKSFMKKILKINNKITIMREMEDFTSGTVCYIITCDFIKKILKEVLPIKDPVDMYLGTWFRRARLYSINMKYNRTLQKDLSPFFMPGKWDAKIFYSGKTDMQSSHESVENKKNVKQIIKNFEK